MPASSPSSARSHASLTPLLQQAVARLAPVLPLLSEVGERFSAGGHELALVGGPVRDAFLGRVSPDLDLTTSARPEQIEALVAGWADAVWDVGREFGTIALRKGEHTLEITTYRADEYDRTTRKPVVAFGDNLHDDLIRRDFTVNAMALRVPSLEFVDPHGGLAHLAAKTLVTPSAPEVSFADDPLRMMRAARFVSQLGFTVSPEVFAAMQERASTLSMVSAERIRDEFVKLLCGAHPRDGLRVFVDSGLAELVIPEVPGLRMTQDEHARHKDVYEHTLMVVEQAIDLEGAPDAPADQVPGPDFILRMAALMHDVAKPATRRIEDDGRVTFYHHDVVGAKMTRNRMRAMRFDKDTTKKVARLVELHLRFHGYGGGDWTDSAVRRYVTDAGDLLAHLHRLTRADCTTRNVRKAQRLARTYDHLEERIAELAAQEELASVRPELNGHQIMQTLGIKPGPVLGRAYDHLVQVRLDQGPIGEDAARAELLRWWQEQPERETS